MMHSFLGLFDCLVVVDALLELLNTVDLRTLLETNKQILCAVKSLRSHSSLVRGIRYINRFSLSSPHESVEWIDYTFSRSGHTLHHILSSPSLYLRFDTNKGWCVMSASTILSRSHILVYNGELISSSTVRQLQSMAEPKVINLNLFFFVPL